MNPMWISGSNHFPELKILASICLFDISMWICTRRLRLHTPRSKLLICPLPSKYLFRPQPVLFQLMAVPFLRCSGQKTWGHFFLRCPTSGLSGNPVGSVITVFPDSNRVFPSPLPSPTWPAPPCVTCLAVVTGPLLPALPSWPRPAQPVLNTGAETDS